jgi:hypothetical protein
MESSSFLAMSKVMHSQTWFNSVKLLASYCCTLQETTSFITGGKIASLMVRMLFTDALSTVRDL